MNVLEKMGTFSTIVKRYVKTVDPPVSDHGGMFELTDIFFPVCPTVHTYELGENCHRKCVFS